MKRKPAEYIEGPKAAENFMNLARKVIAAKKSEVQLPKPIRRKRQESEEKRA
jgi:hypothetical protein